MTNLVVLSGHLGAYLTQLFGRKKDIIFPNRQNEFAASPAFVSSAGFLQSRFNKLSKQMVRPIGLGFKLRVKLDGNEIRVVL